MSRHVELRHNPDTPIPRIFDHFSHLILRVKEAIGSLFLQQGKLLAFNPKTLVFRKMPMENVKLDRFHSIECPINHLERHKMPAGVEHHTAPREARPVVDGHGWNNKSTRADADQLKECLQAV